MASSGSTSGRFSYALIGALFGAVMGAALCYGAVFAFALPRVAVEVIPFSSIYFALVGLIMRAYVGDFVGASISGLLDVLFDARSTSENTFNPVWLGATFLLWLVGSWIIYLRE